MESTHFHGIWVVSDSTIPTPLSFNDPPIYPLSMIIIVNIKTYVTLTVEMDEINYEEWQKKFQTRCLSFSVVDHLNEAIVSTLD